MPVQMEFMNAIPLAFWPNQPDINLGKGLGSAREQVNLINPFRLETHRAE
jgi:hypothetical protein